MRKTLALLIAITFGSSLGTVSAIKVTSAPVLQPQGPAPLIVAVSKEQEKEREKHEKRREHKEKKREKKEKLKEKEQRLKIKEKEVDKKK